MKTVEGFEHRAAVHCESGSLQNLLRHAGVEVSEAMVFGVGSGALFYYLFFAEGPAKLPLVGVRNPPGDLWKNVRQLCGIDLSIRKMPSVGAALAEADRLLDAGKPCTAMVDMFRMKYLPSFLRIHAPFHFIVLIGRDGDNYRVSDPYMPTLATLSREDLAVGWEPHATMGKDDLLCHLVGVPEHIDWKKASIAAIRRASRDMLPPQGLRQLLWFVGVQGMRTYAKKIRQWPKHYRGVALRQGIFFSAVASEDQGTGGASFRLLYAAFLAEVARLCDSTALAEISERFATHGQEWRATMRRLIVLGKALPDEDAAYDDWLAANAAVLHDGLEDVASTYERFATVEQGLYEDLARVAKGLA